MRKTTAAALALAITLAIAAPATAAKNREAASSSARVLALVEILASKITDALRGGRESRKTTPAQEPERDSEPAAVDRMAFGHDPDG